eukprot:4505891-Ditylum_brightwellii.AAC.2
MICNNKESTERSKDKNCEKETGKTIGNHLGWQKYWALERSYQRAMFLFNDMKECSSRRFDKAHMRQVCQLQVLEINKLGPFVFT